MIKEEAIEILKRQQSFCLRENDWYKALSMAIEALQASLDNGVSMRKIDDIRTEIRQTLDADWSDGLYQALHIIDKYISGKENE